MGRYKYDIMEISKAEALEMVEKFHYSNSLPRLNKIFLGFYLQGEIVGVVTLGWGTRPKHTIKKLYPNLESKDYLEIGRMCMTEEMPRNSESQMLSQLVKWLRVNHPEVKILFTWADGMLGKVGYVYQGSNFLYAGYSNTDFYMRDGVKLHPRATRQIFGNENETRLTVRPSYEQMQQHNIKHYKGKQFKYIYILDKGFKEPCEVELTRVYPKESDLTWKEKTEPRKFQSCGKPQYKTDVNFKI